MTTLVGVTSAAADYFATFHHRLGYRFWVVVFTLMTTIVSTFGLDTLLRVTIPALLMIYPTAVTLVLLQFIRNKLKAPRFTYRFTIAIIVLMSLFDTLKQLKWLNADLLQLFSYIPLSDYGLGWVLPGIIAFVISLIISLNFKETEPEITTPNTIK